MANRKRNIQLKMYLSDEEYQAFIKQVNKSKLTQTDFFIRCVTNKKVIVVEGLKDILVELKRIGSNINQIAKSLNGGIFQDAEKEVREIRRQFLQVTDCVIELLKGIG